MTATVLISHLDLSIYWFIAGIIEKSIKTQRKSKTKLHQICIPD
jgi:hypothetical protein